MIKLWLHAANHAPAVLDAYDKSVEQVLDDVRQHWNEEPEGSQLFWLTDENGTLLATIFRHATDSERAITTYPDGRVEVHQCEYRVNEQGRYESTEVRRLS